MFFAQEKMSTWAKNKIKYVDLSYALKPEAFSLVGSFPFRMFCA